MNDETLEEELAGIARRTGSVDRTVIGYKRKLVGEAEFVTPEAARAAYEAALAHDKAAT